MKFLAFLLEFVVNGSGLMDVLKIFVRRADLFKRRLSSAVERFNTFGMIRSCSFSSSFFVPASAAGFRSGVNHAVLELLAIYNYGFDSMDLIRRLVFLSNVGLRTFGFLAFCSFVW